ncbi:MAG: ABC transporter permease [Microgenomates group bacterium]
MIASILRPFHSHKFLLYQLVQREIKARYKQSMVGYFWVLLNPLSQMLVYTFVFSIIFRFPSEIPYPLFLFAALLPWTFFQSSISAAADSLVSNDILLKKVAFPREIIVYSVIVAKTIDFLFASLIFVVMMALYSVPFGLSALWFFALLLIQIVLTTGLSCLLAAFNLFYRDVQHLTRLFLMIGMYLTPVVYPLSMVPARFVWVYKLNPLVGIVEGYRSALFGFPFETSIILWSALVSLAVFVFGYAVFKYSEKYFADIV